MVNGEETIHTNTLACIAGAVGLVFVALTSGLASAQASIAPPAQSQSDTAMTYEQMRRMMVGMHGQRASERMHEAMGDDAERMMDQCTAMISMTRGTRAMMGDDPMPGMMGEPGRGSMSDMMRHMMGHRERTHGT